MGGLGLGLPLKKKLRTTTPASRTGQIIPERPQKKKIPPNRTKKEANIFMKRSSMASRRTG
jgi:hypothetical protein